VAALLPVLRAALDGAPLRAGATLPAPGLLLARLLGEAGVVRARCHMRSLPCACRISTSPRACRGCGRTERSRSTMAPCT
jgi:hypothetical protein